MPGPGFSRLSLARGLRQGAIAYDHSLTLTVPADKVGAHLTRLRDFCLSQVGCELISATEDADDRSEEEDRRHARLSARVPHDEVDAFLEDAAAPVTGETGGSVVTQALQTNERDLSAEMADVGRRLAQMTAYRDRLEALEEKSASKPEDLIKVAKELSEAQTELESGMREQKRLSRQVATEEITTYYESARANLGPLRRSWKQTGVLFSESLADVWAFLIQALVWAPLVVVGLLLVRRAVRRGWFSRS
ncbi:hypothetical protein JCM15831A_07020 [Asaia astilbis]